MVHIFLVAVLITSGFSKFFFLKSFRITIHNLGLSSRLAFFLSILIPLLECIIAILLISPRMEKLSEFSLVSLLLIFLIVVVYSLSKNKKVSCNCFGNLSEEKMGYQTIIRILLLLSLNILLIWKNNDFILINYSLIDLISMFLISFGIIIIYLFGQAFLQNQEHS